MCLAVMWPLLVWEQDDKSCQWLIQGQALDIEEEKKLKMCLSLFMGGWAIIVWGMDFLAANASK